MQRCRLRMNLIDTQLETGGSCEDFKRLLVGDEWSVTLCYAYYNLYVMSISFSLTKAMETIQK